MTVEPQYLCGVCGKEVSDDDTALQCEGLCQNWHHTGCVDVDNDLYTFLTESEVFWECPKCNPSGMPAFDSVDALDVFNFDFQQNLPTPKLTVGQQFYHRLLWTYLLGIFSASTKVTTAFMRHELMGVMM